MKIIGLDIYAYEVGYAHGTYVMSGDRVASTAATSHVAATTRPESLIMTPFFNDWTDGHLCGHQPRSSGGFGSAPTGPGLGVEVDIGRLGKPLFSVGA